MKPDDSLTDLFRLRPVQKQALEKLGLETPRDLLFYFPGRYGARREEKQIVSLRAGEEATITGQVASQKISRGWKSKIPLGEMTIDDGTGRIKAIWFHQPYLAQKAKVGQWVRLGGKVGARSGLPRRGQSELYLANPEIDPVSGGIEPAGVSAAGGVETALNVFYPETRGLSSLWCRYAVRKILKCQLHRQISDPLPAEILAKYRLPSLSSALVWIHLPRKESDAIASRKRFAFEEVFFVQLSRLVTRQTFKKLRGLAVKIPAQEIKEFASRLPFELTNAQRQAVRQIAADLAKPQPMTRLLEGDVGSGKTAVAAITALAVVQNRGQVAYMAPTEILARQHFESFINYFRHLAHVQIGLLTGAECRKFPSKINPSGHTHISRSQLLKWVGAGQIPILVGTHALIQKEIRFKNLAYVIIDEQHRFGVRQRAELLRQESGGGRSPHLLSMTATPIPRTLALTIYGDLDLTLLDQMPPGRKPIVTKVISEAERDTAYEAIRRELNGGQQAFVICPRIEEPDLTKALALNVKSAKAEAARLKKEVFPEFSIGLLHGKLKTKEKEQTMRQFTEDKLKILVATSVVEVGVDIPNASVILIEGADRFGLAQLHQLRGRVLRSAHQAYCFLLAAGRSAQALRRLRALGSAKSGFELSELDLKLRGPGALGGGKQWGLSDIGMEALTNLKMVEAAREEAKNILAADSELKNYPLIKERLALAQEAIHFE